MGKGRLFLPFLLAATLALLMLLPWAGFTGEYHTGGNLICFDCHTIHYSQQHQYDGTPGQGSKPLSGGPTAFLLRQPGAEICQTCHDGQSFAPDVIGANFNPSPSEGRQAGAVNKLAGNDAGYDTWKGHTLYSTATPPGYNPSLVGLGDWYTPADGLACYDCHSMHGVGGSYRNLAPYSLGASVANFQPSYVISTTNDTTKDVWINLASYTPGSGNAATFNPYYDRKNIFFNRIDGTVGSLKTSNKIGNFCAACHSNFHGGPGNANIGASPGILDGFLRHPTAQVTIGASSAQGYGGHSNLGRYTSATNKVKVLTTDYVGFTDASPGCITCHKAHGNQNPFGLIFMARTSGTPSEEGTTTDVNTGIRNLCGQCHGQGN